MKVHCAAAFRWRNVTVHVTITLSGMGHTQHHKTALCVVLFFKQSLPQGLFYPEDRWSGFLRNAGIHQTAWHHNSADRSLNIHGLETWIIDKATLIKGTKMKIKIDWRYISTSQYSLLVLTGITAFFKKLVDIRTVWTENQSDDLSQKCTYFTVQVTC